MPLLTAFASLSVARIRRKIRKIESVVTSILMSDSSLKVGETSTLTITFDQAVTGFDNTYITVASGTLTDITSADGGITWTGTFTPTDDIEDTTNVIAAGTLYTDLLGNVLSTDNYTIDTKEPVVVSAVMSDSALLTGETSTLTITFSEAVTGFDNADISLANGTLTAVTSTNGGVTWTGTFTPTSGIIDTSNVILVGTTLTDLAGNAPLSGGSTANYTINTPLLVEYLVVAGGGSGGFQGGGGGGGGMLSGSGKAVTPGTVYGIVIGGGGSAKNTNVTRGSNGGNSSGLGITATGGGGGGTNTGSTSGTRHGIAGGSGGGASSQNSIGTGGTGISGQGNAGGSGTTWATNRRRSRGGGGRGGAGVSGTGSALGTGGAGLSSSITGSAVVYAGGGGGNDGTGGGRAAGGSGAGAGGANYVTGFPPTSTSSLSYGGAGVVNRGGGGGGGVGSGAGGSGVVVIRYPITSPAATVTGSPTVTVVGGNRIYKFTSSGSIRW